MDAHIKVDGRVAQLSRKEAKVALQAVTAYRRSIARYTKAPVKQERDMQIYDLYRSGMSEHEIARAYKITVLKVRGALGRVENGRYGAVDADGLR